MPISLITHANSLITHGLAPYHTCPGALSHMLSALSHMPCASVSGATDGSRRNPSATATTGGARPIGAFPTDSAAFRQIPGAFAESPRKESAPLDSVPPIPIPLITHASGAYHTCLRAYHTCLSAYHTCLGGPAPDVRQAGSATEPGVRQTGIGERPARDRSHGARLDGTVPAGRAYRPGPGRTRVSGGVWWTAPFRTTQ